MSRHHITRRTIRLYAVFASVTAALGIGIALSADPWPGHDRAVPTASATAAQPRQADAPQAAYTDDQPITRTGSS
jgi:hypothetical protein